MCYWIVTNNLTISDMKERRDAEGINMMIGRIALGIFKY